MEVAPVPDMNEWITIGDDEPLLPPISRRPVGRPRKNRIKGFDEVKKSRHKCKRCGSYGHHEKKKCKEPEKESDPSTQSIASPSSTQQVYRGRSSSRGGYHVYVPPTIKRSGRPRKIRRENQNQGVGSSMMET